MEKLRYHSSLIVLYLVISLVIISFFPGPRVKSEENSPRKLLLDVLTDVRGSAGYRYNAKDDRGARLDTIKIIESPAGGYLGVYHYKMGSKFEVRLARSSNLLDWYYARTLEEDASQPYIYYHEESGGFLIAYEKEGDDPHLKFEYFEGLDNLLHTSPRTTFEATQRLSNYAEGTPNIYNATPDLSEVTVGFHYFRNGFVDRVAMGELKGLLTSTPQWSAYPQGEYNKKLSPKGVDGNIGDRDYIQVLSHKFNLQEGQLTREDWGSWRLWLYDYQRESFTEVDIQTHKGSPSIGNGTFTILESPSGKPAIVVTCFLFTPAAAPGEGGELIYYHELPEL